MCGVFATEFHQAEQCVSADRKPATAYQRAAQECLFTTVAGNLLYDCICDFWGEIARHRETNSSSQWEVPGEIERDEERTCRGTMPMESKIDGRKGQYAEIWFSAAALAVQLVSPERKTRSAHCLDSYSTNTFCKSPRLGLKRLSALSSMAHSCS